MLFSFKMKSKFNLKSYFYRVLLINVSALVYLSNTYSFDLGFISIQSLIYCIHIYLLYFFIFFEGISALFNQYGLDFNFYKLIIRDIDNLNYSYVWHILYENINIFYYFIFTILIIFYLEKKKYKLNFKYKSYTKNQKFFLISFIIALMLSNINPSLSHQSVIERVKGITNTWTKNDRIFNNHIKYYNQNVKNDFFRNDNWFNTLKFSIIYSNKFPENSEKLIYLDDDEYLKNFEKIITQKKFNNIYVIINESYPNFRNQNLKNNLFKKIVSNNNNLNIQKFKKKWNRSITTQGSEMNFFCDKEVDYEDFKKSDLEQFLERNNCWISNMKNKNLIYIHSYKESFFNRSRYKNFFNKSYFRKDLHQLGIKKCKQKFDGVCDYDVINNINKLIKKKSNNFVIFLTLNNHIPAEPITKKKYIDCENVFPLNLSKQFCVIYNNQMFFNESLSKFISNDMGEDDLLVLFSDTPPMFPGKRRIHFEDTIDIYFIKKI